MNIIINGGSRGIGREVVLQLATDKDNQILATGRNEEKLRELMLESPGKNISFLTIDMTDLDNKFESTKNQIYNRFSKVDILINMAGQLVVSDFMKLSESDSRGMMETNFFGPARLIKLVVPIMPAGSHIINISSMGAFQGSSKFMGLSVYSASKAALACLSECLAVELRESGISVNCLALGSVSTEMFENAFPGSLASLNPDEIAEFIAYFAINGNKFFNGKVLPVAVNNP
jgi:short-subunit dehydrogenase